MLSKNRYNYNDFSIRRKYFSFKYPYQVYSADVLLFNVKRNFSFSRGYTYELHDADKNPTGVVIKYVKGKFFSAVYNYEILNDDKLVGRIKFENLFRSSGEIFDEKDRLIAKVQHEKSGTAYFLKHFLPFSKDKLFFKDLNERDIGYFAVSRFFSGAELHLDSGKLDKLLALAIALLIANALYEKRRRNDY